MAANSVTPLDAVTPDWAWSPFVPDAQHPWTADLANHLFRRAGFGASWADLERSRNDGLAATIDRLLKGEGPTERFLVDSRATADSLLASDNRGNLPAWWLHSMLRTPHPLLEKMTLFWHGHFATSGDKVKDPRLMLQQNELLRRHALGKFGALLDEMARDPAMLIWLDSAVNRKARPNENFAREVMELFSLGLGQYTETDIKAAARAFTGFEVRQGGFKFNRSQHDPGEKTVLGRTGPWSGGDIVKILLDQPATGMFIVGKLFRYLVSETASPPTSLLVPLAEGWRSREYDMSWLARTILSSNLFFSEHALRQRIKSPVEFGLGLVKSLEGTSNMYALAEGLETLGQAVFYPPNVKGWDGGLEWINSSTLVARANLAWSMLGDGDSRFRGKIALDKLQALVGVSEPAARVRRLTDLLLGGPLPDAVFVQLTALASDPSIGEHARLAHLTHAIVTLPEFHLA